MSTLADRPPPQGIEFGDNGAGWQNARGEDGTFWVLMDNGWQATSAPDGFYWCGCCRSVSYDIERGDGLPVCAYCECY